MANGRGNFGFNIGGGGGGIANLIQAPKVTPVRSIQFAPTPRPQIQRDEKDPKKQILGALLGGAAPFLADAGLEKLAKVGGFEDKFFKPDPVVREEFGVTAPTTGLGPITSPYEREQTKLRSRVEAALPSSRLPRQKTLLGKGLSELLTYAPAAIFAGDEDDGSVASYIAADLQNLVVHSYYNADNGLTKAHQTRALRAKDGTTYIMSRGNPAVDKDTDGQLVPAGKYYISYNNSFEDGSSPAAKTETYMDTNSSFIVQAINREIRDEFGDVDIQSEFVLPDGTSMTRRQFLKENPSVNLIGYNQGLYASRNPPTDKIDPKLVEEQRELQGRTEALNRMLAVSTDVLRSAYVNVPFDEETGKYIILDPNTGEPNWDAAQYSALSEGASKLAQFLYGNVVNFEESLMKAGYGTSNAEAFENFIKAQVAPKGGTNVLDVSKAVQQYQASLNLSVDEGVRKRQRDQLVRQLESLQESTKDEFAGSDKPKWLDFDAAQLLDYVDQKGLYAASQIRLAYMAASATGQTGRTLSDRDIAFFMDQLGFGDNSPSTIAKKVARFGSSELLAWDQANEDRFALVRERENFPQLNEEQQNEIIDKHHAALAGQFGLSVRQKAQLDSLKDIENPIEAKILSNTIRYDMMARNSAGLGLSQWEYDEDTQSFRYVPFTERFQNQPFAEELLRYWEGVGYGLDGGPDKPYYDQNKDGKSDSLDEDNEFIFLNNQNIKFNSSTQR